MLVTSAMRERDTIYHNGKNLLSHHECDPVYCVTKQWYSLPAVRRAILRAQTRKWQRVRYGYIRA